MLIAVGSWRGSPGATTVASALAGYWSTSRRAYMAECDPRGGTIVTRFLMSGPRGLTELAGQARRGGDLSLLGHHALEVPCGGMCLTGPEDGRQLRAALRMLLVPGGLFEQAADDPDLVLVADLGRIEPKLPETASLLVLAEALILVARPVPEQILALSAARDEVRALHPNIGLSLIGPGYPSSQVADLLEMSVLGTLPLIPTGAGALIDRLTPKRRNAFATAAAHLGGTIAGRHAVAQADSTVERVSA